MEVDVQTCKWGCEQKCFRNTGSEASPKMGLGSCSGAGGTAGSALRGLLPLGVNSSPAWPSVSC